MLYLKEGKTKINTFTHLRIIEVILFYPKGFSLFYSCKKKIMFTLKEDNDYIKFPCYALFKPLSSKVFYNKFPCTTLFKPLNIIYTFLEY